ncbi:MAG TPA: MFS transporter [Methylomirabilota bacterium]|jgi:MFS family permease|nr:MFS transporter [Methylomirabilota bacterium]
MDIEMTPNGKPIKAERFFYGWFIVGILFFISVIDGGFTYIFSAFLKPLSQEFGWTRAETSGAFSLYLLAAGLTLPFWGWLADQRGVKVVFLGSAVIDGVALFLLSYMDSLAFFYLLYLLLGVGLGGIGPTTVGKIISQWFVAKRGRAMGIALVGAGGGGLVLVPLTGFLIETFNWRLAYQGLAVLALGGMLPLVWLFLTNTPAERGLKPLGADRQETDNDTREMESDEESGDWTLKAALATSTFWLLGVAFCLGLTAALSIAAHQVALLQDAGLSLEAASTIAGITLGMSMGGRFIVGWASEHARHLHPILACCLLIQATGLGILWSFTPLGFWPITGFSLLFGLGYGGLVVLWPLAIGHDFGVRSLGAIAGVLGSVSAGVGGSIGPVLIGAMYDQTGSYQGALLLCIGLLVIGAGAAGLTTEPRAVQATPAPRSLVSGKEGPPLA